MDVKGLTIQQILNMDASDIARMDNSTLSKVTGRLVSASNKRLRRLGKNTMGKYSPAYINTMKSGYFSTRTRAGESGMNLRNRLVNTFTETKQFLEMKTSTISGWEEVRTNVEERIGKMNHTQSMKFWKTYRKLEEQAQAQGTPILNSKTFKNNRNNSERIQKMLYASYKERGWKSPKSSVEDILKSLDKRYKLEQERLKRIERAEEEELEQSGEPTIDIDFIGNK